MGKILSLAIMICLSTSLFSQVQNQAQPVEGTWEGEEVFVERIDSTEGHISAAYMELEPQVLADIDWLNYYPLDEQQSLRDDKNRFVLMWMSGSPSIKIGMDDRIVTFQGAEPWILMAYMMGWTKYSLEHNYSNDPVECTTAAVTNAVNFYNRNRKSLARSKGIEKYAKMVKNDSLKKHISDILSQPVAQ